MKNPSHFLIALLFLAGMFTACDSARVFDEYREIPQSGWHKDSLIVFNIPVTDTIGNHNLLVQIRNETRYRFSNLWLFIEVIQPNGTSVKDTFEVVLADPAGRWLGEGHGGLKSRQVMFRRDVSFPASGELKISLQHGMREEILEGIHDVGFRIEKTSP